MTIAHNLTKKRVAGHLRREMVPTVPPTPESPNACARVSISATAHARVPRTPEADKPALTRDASSHNQTALLTASLHAHLDELRRTVNSASRLIEGLTGQAAGEPGVIQRHAARRIPRWHFPMLNDQERNNAFATALERSVRPDDHVLDIGSGTGLLAMMAVQAGAAHVTTCEADPLLAEVARQVIAANGMSDEITVISALSSDLLVGEHLATPADLIVTEIVDCGLVGEGLLPTIRHARTHLLKPGGRLIPTAARVRGAVLSSEVVRGLNRVGRAGGFDVGALNSFATPGHFPIRLGTWPHRQLSCDSELFAFDLLSDELVDDGHVRELQIHTSGVGDGLVAWFEMGLGSGVTLCNSPANSASHWMQAFIPFAEPLELEAGESLPLEIRWQCDQLTARPATTIQEG
jgi:arginine Nomega-methyltransferase